MKKIAFISQPEYFRFIYENDLKNIFEVREFSFNFDMTADQFNDLIDFDADYNIFFRGEFFPEKVLEKIKGIKIALSSEPFPRKINNSWKFTFDSMKRYMVFRDVRKKNFDYVFHYDITSLDLFKKDGLNISGEFAFPVAREVYAPVKTEKKWDLFFIGRSTSHREKFFGPLKHHFNFLHIAHGIWGPDLVEYINKSKICINAHAEDEISWEPRMQMLLATGAFVMSEKITPNNYLRPGIDYIEFSNNYDLYKKVEYYLTHHEERDKIVRNAQERIAKLFDSKKRFFELINDIEDGKYDNFKTSHGFIFFDVIKKIYDGIKKIIKITNKFKMKRIFGLVINARKEFQRSGIFGVIRRVSNEFGITDLSIKLFGRWSKIKCSLSKRKKIYGKDASIAYVIPGVKISGGVAIILNHANRLKKRGYDVRILTFSKETEIDWFNNSVPVFSVIDISKSDLSKIDIMIATHWSTAFWVDLSDAPRHIYFIQSDERRFNPENKSEIKTITATYKMDMEFMTEAKWIQAWLKNEFNRESYYVPNGLETDIFFNDKSFERKSKRLRILLEGPIDFWFKGMSKAYEAVKDLDCEIWIISSHGKPKSNWKYDKFFENIPMEKMKDIYSSCDIFLKMSYMEGFFGPPMEAMACGCSVVVSKVTGYDEYIIDGYNALVVEQGDIKGAQVAVKKIMTNADLRNNLIENGYKTVKDWGWDNSINLLENVIAGDKPKKYYDGSAIGKYVYEEEINRLKLAKNEIDMTFRNKK